MREHLGIHILHLDQIMRIKELIWVGMTVAGLFGAAGSQVVGQEVRPTTCGTTAVLHSLQKTGLSPSRPQSMGAHGLDQEELTPGGRFLLRYGATGSPSRAVGEVGRTLDAAWQILVQNGGWPDPTRDGPLEVNLLNGFAEGPSRTLPLAAPGAHPEEGVPAALVVTGASAHWPLAALHQFLHAAQLSGSAREELWAYESTALALEDRLLGGGMLDRDLLKSLQATPQRSLAGETPDRVTAAAPFLAWLAATRGDDVLARWWQRAASDWGDNSLVALDATLRLTDLIPLDEAWRNFTVWSAYPDKGLRPHQVAPGLARTLPVTAAAATITQVPAADTSVAGLTLEPLGHAVLRLQDLDGIGAVFVELTAEPGAEPGADALVRWPHVEAGWLAVPFHFIDGVARLGIPLEPGTEVALILRDHRRQGEPLAMNWEVNVDHAFPFELSFLAAEASPSGIDLTWGSESERGLFGWLVYRSTKPGGPFVPVGSIPFPALGETAGPLSYHFADASVRPGRLYYYLVEGLTLDGLAKRSPVVVRRSADGKLSAPATAGDSR